MDLKEYRQRGKEMVDYIADYLETIRGRRVFPDVQPGYMRSMLPDSAPFEGENFSCIMEDIERVIMPGMTHWQSPYMHAYFPGLNSPASLLGCMLADGIGCLGFTWASSPACTELEVIVMDWLGEMINLPKKFLHKTPGSTGGGVIQTTASESTFVCLLAARTEAILRLKQDYQDVDDSELNTKLVAYTSDQSHSSVEKAALIALVKIRCIESDSKFCLGGDKVIQAIRKDREKGLIPFFLCATLGTTGVCAFDNLREIGPICKSENIWIHVDAAYAGSAFICPEFRRLMIGVEFVSSFVFNPTKWMLVNFDCTAMWIENSESLHRTFNINPLYLQHENTGYAVDFMHWQIALSKRFRALKLWFVIRNYGIKGIQEHIRKAIRLAQLFESKVLSDDRFEIPAERHLGLVVFRIIGENELTEALLKKINASGLIHCVPTMLKDKYVIRFAVTSPHTTSVDIERDWRLIQQMACTLLHPPLERAYLLLSEEEKLNYYFGRSLLLSNSPMIPKVINGSFSAISEKNEWSQEFQENFDRNFRDLAKKSPILQRQFKAHTSNKPQFLAGYSSDKVTHSAGSDESDDANTPYRLIDPTVRKSEGKRGEQIVRHNTSKIQ